MDWTIIGLRFDVWQEEGIVLLTEVYQLDVGSIQLPLHWL
jgi:hypothetical protein